jgi:hypothetical protein
VGDLVTEPTPGFRQTLTWKGGFWLALVIPMSGLTLVGYGLGIRGRRRWRDVPGSPARATETVRSGA